MCWIFSICLFSALLLSSAFSDHHHGPEHSQSEKMLSAPNADFAFALYNNLKAKTPAENNIFFSPLGISTALSMVSAGAGGETHSQLFSTLGYSAFNQTQVNEAYKHLFDMLGHNEESLQLDVGNAAAVGFGFSPSETFLTDVKDFYNGEVFNVDITNLSEAAAEINRFIANKTRDKITDMVKDLDPDTVLVLINYVYFNGKWENPFRSHLTRKADFQVNKTTVVKVDMMERTGFYKAFWDRENHATLVMLPYKGNVSMIIVLPDEDKMESVESYINTNTFKHWINSLSQSFIELYVPKFSISADAALKSTLKEMGIENAFGNNADFSGISGTNLKISKVSHKTALSVTEMGTEATAVTVSEVTIVMLPPSIRIDRPFLVFILDNTTRSILFMGKISDPTAK